jgi:hypothetical protein
MQELQHHMLKKAELDSECPCFDEFSERRFELAAKLQTEKLPGDLQDAKYLFVVGSEFREEFLRVQPKCDLVGVQDHAYSFRNARNRENVAQRLQKFVHWDVFFKETFLHRRFAVVALNVHGLRRFAIDENHIGFLQFGEAICDLN